MSLPSLLKVEYLQYLIQYRALELTIIKEVNIRRWAFVVSIIPPFLSVLWISTITDFFTMIFPITKGLQEVSNAMAKTTSLNCVGPRLLRALRVLCSLWMTLMLLVGEHGCISTCLTFPLGPQKSPVLPQRAL